MKTFGSKGDFFVNFQVGTDLACESMAEVGRDLPDSKYRERQVGNFRICYLHIEDAKDSELLHRPIGTYITVECGGIMTAGAREESLLSALLAEEL